MICIRNDKEMDAALTSPIDPELKLLLRRRRMQLAGYDGYALEDLAHFVVIEPSDRLVDVEAALGFTPVVNFVDGQVLGHPDFTPSWESAERHSGWIELVFILSDDGFGHVMLIPDHPVIDPTLSRLCVDHI